MTTRELDISERTISVRFTAEGFHRWPEAADVLPNRAYLSSVHRHLFHLEVTVSVDHNDRDVEFHELLAWSRKQWPGPDLGRQSCEDIAAGYLVLLATTFGDRRSYRVAVWEDNEVGATLASRPRPSSLAEES